ncbi:MAG: bifunctional phosphopantothenoylcysteine decarboxylase/phosphopantothenate--cysteine ligase CoaBC, partial [Candidatus Heimdallarchaeota archaeon]|nr:bifunctional phosphopantothenoylcysteine decarboxylase/phosphopantothenate--cysteine ligase CoaBC [Candidatus Heimdallarchaeota archaeon]MCK4876151.1 bifunctional phosphopantothenoylcysteine decarboxylase/phosphopantothenate--cysteine ligase CoaBC [Candidatus Heimdallarchaeota archaeon]
ILHCVTSSISCFLAPQISRKLMRYGAKVIPVLSAEAAKFIDPMIFEWATGEKPITVIEGQVEHIKYAGLSKDKVDLVLIAPITASSLSKIANGIMDTTVTLMAGTALGNKIPMIMVPTMHEVMMNNPAIIENIAKLKEMNVSFISPRVEEEKAKIPEEEEIVNVCLKQLYTDSLKNKRILVTAGPTRAYIDGIRFISNPSSGKMGYSIALEAWRRYAEVKLVYGSSSLEPPLILENTVSVDTAKGMYDEVLKLLEEEQYDYVILAAAMNDFKLENVSDTKISSSESLELKLQPTKKLADKIKEISPNSKLILFKAEYKKSEGELIDIALKRMHDAKADMIVANDVSEKKFGFESDDNRVVIINISEEKNWVEGSKLVVAKSILDQAENLEKI